MPVVDILSGREPITDTSSAPQPAPQSPSVDASADIPAAPQAPQTDSIAGLGGSIPSVSPGAPRSSSRWGDVLRGALSGLLVGGIPGAVAGAASPGTIKRAQQRQEQFADDRLKTADAQAAVATAHAAIAKAQLANLPEETQNAIDDHGMRLAEFFAKQQFMPALVTDNTPEAAYAGLQQLARINGGQLPMHTEVRLAGKLVYYTVPKTATNLDSLKIVNNLRSVEGLQPIAHDDWVSPKFNREKATADASTLLAPNGDQLNPSKIQGEIARRQIIRTNYASFTPDSDPQKAENLKQLDDTISMMKAIQTGELKNMLDTKRGSAQATAEGKAAGTPAKPTKADTNLYFGSTPTGEQVAGSSDELKAAGVSSFAKLPADESKKVIVARQMLAPNGLFHSVANDLSTLEQKGKLGVVASRWSDFMAGKVGSEPDFAPLRADMGLLATALMQAHVGARGSHDILEHFSQLADYRISDSATLRAALSREFSYVREKAMLPRKGNNGGQ